MIIKTFHSCVIKDIEIKAVWELFAKTHQRKIQSNAETGSIMITPKEFSAIQPSGTFCENTLALP